MGRYATGRRDGWLAAIAVVAIAAASAGGTLLLHSRDDADAGAEPSASSSAAGVAAGSGRCSHLAVLTAASYAPVLEAVKPRLAAGNGCVQLDVTVKDGRAAVADIQKGAHDVWIPDDPAWAGIVSDGVLAKGDVTGAGTVLASSPIYMVSDDKTAERITKAGGTWLGLSRLLSDRTAGMRLAVRNPSDSGDGMVAAGSVGEAVWIKDGMDASSLSLAEALGVTRTVTSSEAALPTRAGEVGLVPEYALLASADKLTSDALMLPGKDHTSLLRWSWFPTAEASDSPATVAALAMLRSALQGADGQAAAGKAFLREPDASQPPPGVSLTLPKIVARPFPVLEPHHVDHVFATWYVNDRRSNLLMALDISGSMRHPARGDDEPLINLVRRGTQQVAGLLPDDAQLGVWEFGSRLDGPRDHREVLSVAPMNRKHRTALERAVKNLDAEKTGTGLYDTILAAYTTSIDAYEPGVQNQVMVFTDGRNEYDPGSISARQLADRLRRAQREDAPVALTVIAFGTEPDVKTLEKAVEPVDGDVEHAETARAVTAAFVHVAAGGIHDDAGGSGH